MLRQLRGLRRRESSRFGVLASVRGRHDLEWERALSQPVQLGRWGCSTALSEYVERHGYDGVVAWFAEHGR